MVSRLALLPISIWGKNRTRREVEIVIPKLKKLEPLVAKRVFEEMERSKIRGDKKLLKKYHKHKCMQLLTMQRKELLKQYKCSPLPSIIAPISSQLPFFVGFSILLSNLSVSPTPFDSESFFTLSTLAHPDPTMTLPVILGFLTMANVESGNWVLNATEREQVRKAEEEHRKRILESGKLQFYPGKILKTSLRGFSVVRIIIAAIAPGSVTLYWVSSAAFGLVQTWTMEWMETRWSRKLDRSPHKKGRPMKKKRS